MAAHKIKLVSQLGCYHPALPATKRSDPPTTVRRNKMWESISKAASGTRFSILLNTTVIEVLRDTHTGKQLPPSGHRDQSSQEICMHSLEEDCVISHASQ